MLHFVLLMLAAICFVLAAFGVTARVNLIAVGLFCWVLVPLHIAMQQL